MDKICHESQICGAKLRVHKAAAMGVGKYVIAKFPEVAVLIGDGTAVDFDGVPLTELVQDILLRDPMLRVRAAFQDVQD